jgi:N-acetylmuramoyl-L-alanine amidase
MKLRRRTLLRDGMLAVLACGIAWHPDDADAHQQRPSYRRAPVRRHIGSAARPLVVIDPGHGGKDPGCIGIGGAMEKHIVLAVGLELRRQLLAGGRCRVAMTRSTDVFIPLEERVRFARRRRAIVFVSLHANASPDRHACGACVYRFGLHASDAAAAAEAKWENSADRFVSDSIGGHTPIVIHILASLMRRETVRHSAALQQDLVERLGDRTQLTPNAARHARFVVLTAPDIASVLVEMGFLTNRRDAALLRTRTHHIALARAMNNAVEGYVTGAHEYRWRLG